MAYTEINYGTETPQTIDRFGTEQTYAVKGRNGAERVRHVVNPVRTTEVPATAPRRFWWTFNRYTRHHTYRIQTKDDRSIRVNVDASGALTVYLDGREIHREQHERTRQN